MKLEIFKYCIFLLTVFCFFKILPDDVVITTQTSAGYIENSFVFRRCRSFSITQSVERYKKSLQKNPQENVLNRLVDDLENKDSAIALTAALVLVEQRFISEEERLKVVEVIKDDFEKFFDKPLEYKDMVDLHVHTFYSDALGTSSEMVFNAWKQGMKAIAIVNHNTFDGVLEALKAGEILGVKVIPAIELDLKDDSLGIKNIHVLAYFDKGDSEEFNNWLDQISKDSAKIAIDNLYQTFVGNGRRMVNAFNRQKFIAEDGSGEILVLEKSDIIGRVGIMINRARLSEALLDKYGADKIGEDNVTAIMDKYFTKSRGTYFGRHSEKMEDIVEFVVKNGGVLVLPHPTEITKKVDNGSRITDYDKIQALLEKYALIEIDGRNYLGFRGVEVYSYKIFKNKQAEEIDKLYGLLKELNAKNPTYAQYPLIVTAGSDGHFHFDKFAPERIPVIQSGNDILGDLLHQLRLTADVADGAI